MASRCYCGCASIDFAIGGVVPPAGNGIGILADFDAVRGRADYRKLFAEVEAKAEKVPETAPPPGKK